MSRLGTDLSCVDDLSPTLTEVTDRRCLGESLARQITTPKGTLPGNPLWGIDVRAHIFDTFNETKRRALESEIAREWLTDERVDSVSLKVTIVPQGVGNEITIDANVTDGAGPFRLVVTVDKAKVALALPS